MLKFRGQFYRTANYQDWRELLTYPQAVKPAAAELLDELQSLLPVTVSGSEPDRYVDLSAWLDSAQEQGLLKGREKNWLRSILGPEM